MNKSCKTVHAHLGFGCRAKSVFRTAEKYIMPFDENVFLMKGLRLHDFGLEAWNIFSLSCPFRDDYTMMFQKCVLN